LALSQADGASHRLSQLGWIETHPVFEHQLHILDVIDIFRRIARNDHEIGCHADRDRANAGAFTQENRPVLSRNVNRFDGREACLDQKLETALDYTQVNGNMDHHLPGNLNMSFIYVEGESLLMGINDIAVSSGSACTSATLEPSYVLKALGLGDDVAHSSIRFGIGRFNNKAEVDYVADKLIDVVQHLRELSPLYEMVKEGIDLSKIEWAAH